MEFTTLWRTGGTTGWNIECFVHRTEFGLELRAQYASTEIVATKLFRGPDADEKVAEAANQWRLNMLAKGFEEIA